MSATQTRPETVEERAARLELRLQDGFTRIGQMMSRGIDVPTWEEKWVELLREFEALEDELQARPVVLVQQAMIGMPLERRREGE